jgi:hypothetical protein
MRKVLFAGAAAALVYVTVNRAITWLNQPSDLEVAGGYFLLLALVALMAEAGPRLWRRL